MGETPERIGATLNPAGKRLPSAAVFGVVGAVAASMADRLGVVGDILGTPPVEGTPMLLPPAVPEVAVPDVPTVAPLPVPPVLDAPTLPVPEALPVPPAEAPAAPELPPVLPLPPEPPAEPAPPLPPPPLCAGSDVIQVAVVSPAMTIKVFVFMVIEGSWVFTRRVPRTPATLSPRILKTVASLARQTPAEDVCAGSGICLSGTLFRA
jgi:hypothetical protein